MIFTPSSLSHDRDATASEKSEEDKQEEENLTELAAPKPVSPETNFFRVGKDSPLGGRT